MFTGEKLRKLVLVIYNLVVSGFFKFKNTKMVKNALNCMILIILENLF